MARLTQILVIATLAFGFLASSAPVVTARDDWSELEEAVDPPKVHHILDNPPPPLHPLEKDPSLLPFPKKCKGTGWPQVSTWWCADADAVDAKVEE